MCMGFRGSNDVMGPLRLSAPVETDPPLFGQIYSEERTRPILIESGVSKDTLTVSCVWAIIAREIHFASRRLRTFRILILA